MTVYTIFLINMLVLGSIIWTTKSKIRAFLATSMIVIELIIITIAVVCGAITSSFYDKSSLIVIPFLLALLIYLNTVLSRIMYPHDHF